MIFLHSTLIWAFFCVFYSNEADAKVITFPFKRIQRANTSLISYYRKKTTQSVVDYDDTAYVAEIGIGTPPQMLKVFLDTGSYGLYVPDISCNASQKCFHKCSDPKWCKKNCDDYCCGKPSNVSSCDKLNKFDSSKSSSYVHDGTPSDIEYGIGYVMGFLGQDTVSVGDGADKLVIPKVGFLQATNMGKEGDTPFDGVFGLGLLNMDIHSPIITARNAGLLDKPMFSVYLGHLSEEQTKHFVNRDLRRHGPGGAFTFGGLDTVNCGPVIDYVPFSFNLGAYWEFKTSAVSIGESYYKEGPISCISDTGSSVMFIPKDDFSKIADVLGATNCSDQGCNINCHATGPPMEFVINKKTYKLEVPSLILHQDDGICFLAIMANNDEDMTEWVLGETFIRQYCHIYYMGKPEHLKIGFAPVIKH